MMIVTGMDQKRASGGAGFTLVELLMAISILAIASVAMIYGYVLSLGRAEWSAYSLAAQSLAMQRMEQCRAAKWDALAPTPVDMLVTSNFPVQISALDIPISGTNIVYATNVTTIVPISTIPPIKMIRVDCSWQFQSRGVFTNTIVTYRAPDQ